MTEIPEGMTRIEGWIGGSPTTTTVTIEIAVGGVEQADRMLHAIGAIVGDRNRDPEHRETHQIFTGDGREADGVAQFRALCGKEWTPDPVRMDDTRPSCKWCDAAASWLWWTEQDPDATTHPEAEAAPEGDS